MFEGYLIKTGNFIIPLSIMEFDSYKGVNSVLDVDANRDCDGDLHRNALKNKKFKAEFTTIPLTNKLWIQFYNRIKENFVEPKERKLLCTVYIEEDDEYVDGYAYIPDIEFTIADIDSKSNTINYDGIRLAFIQY